MKRSMYRFFAIIGIGTVASIAVPMIVNPRVIPVWAYVTATMVPGLVMGGAGAWYGFATRKQVLRATRLHYRVCWNCGYHLRGLANAGACPECGAAYTFDELRRNWSGEHDRPPSVNELSRADGKPDK